MKKILNITIAIAASISACFNANADKTKNVLDLKHSITDSNIVYPESFELNTQKRLEGWYLKNYTASDDRYKNQGDVNTSDETIRDRLANMNTIIEMPFNQIVRSYIDRYTARGRGTVSTLLGLSNYYMPIFEQSLEENGLPLELKYLPIIESALNPNAVSKAGATGLWQFMLATGKGLDLEISSLVDERRDPYKSSQKAAEYLQSLYDTYGDWSLAIAAYNCGPGNVNKALRRAGGDASEHDFWSIYYLLPAETRGYVPMFIAANYVMTYYPYHNISPVLNTKPLITDTLMISNRVHFNQISEVLDIPIDELRILNPQFRADIIPGRPDRMYTLVLPSQQIHAYIMSEEKILAHDADRYARRTTAQPGEKPSDADDIDEETDTFVAEETPSATPQEPVYVPKTTPKTNSGTAKNLTHKVEPGESLADIAAKYNVCPEDIKSWNNLRRNSLRTGQMLRVSPSSDMAAATTPAPQNTSTNTPAKPAAQTKPVSQPSASVQTQQSTKPKTQPANTNKTVTAQNSAKDKKNTANKNNPKDNKNNPKDNKNNPKDNKAKAKAQPAPTSHSIKNGENLTLIAKKYGVSVDELKKLNNIKGDAIRAGDNLKLPSKGKANNTKNNNNAKNQTQNNKKKGKK